MTVTKHDAAHGNHWHYGTCTRVIGPRGGVKEHITEVRRNGATQLWVTRPDEFRVPIKYGLREYGYLEKDNAHLFHTEEDCPLRHTTGTVPPVEKGN